MSDWVVLFGVGAAKAGTSWLYKYLHDRPDCALRSLKELHYWDTFDPESCKKQVEVEERRIMAFKALQDQARTKNQAWRVLNLERRILDASGLRDVLKADRKDDFVYKSYLEMTNNDAKLFADITPSYGLLDIAMMNRMVMSYESSRVLFLLRDPVERLWSHIRMQAIRQPNPEGEISAKAKGIFENLINNNKEKNIIRRGDYSTISSNLEQAIPDKQLMTIFIEDVWDGPGLNKICHFLGLPEHPAEQKAVHEGVYVELSTKDRERAAKFLAPQYEWALNKFGRLPDVWMQNANLI